MAYATGALTSGQNIIDNLDAFSTSNGFTNVQKYSEGDWYILALQQGSDFWHIGFNSLTNELAVSYGRGHTTDGAFGTHLREQSSYPFCNEVNNLSVYHFFADAYSIKGVIVLSDGQHKHFCFGYTKMGANQGYPIAAAFHWYVFSPYYDDPVSPFHGGLFPYTKSTPLGGYSQIYVNDQFYLFGLHGSHSDHPGFTPVRPYATGPFNTALNFIWTQPSTYNSRSVTETVTVAINDKGTDQLYQPCGEISGMKQLNIAQKNAGEPLDDTLPNWLVFPHLRKGSGIRFSGDYGLAYEQ